MAFAHCGHARGDVHARGGRARARARRAALGGGGRALQRHATSATCKVFHFLHSQGPSSMPSKDPTARRQRTVLVIMVMFVLVVLVLMLVLVVLR